LADLYDLAGVNKPLNDFPSHPEAEIALYPGGDHAGKGPFRLGGWHHLRHTDQGRLDTNVFFVQLAGCQGERGNHNRSCDPQGMIGQHRVLAD
jgi:hypothetical protein